MVGGSGARLFRGEVGSDLFEVDYVDVLEIAINALSILLILS
jgi:hypothetical protein